MSSKTRWTVALAALGVITGCGGDLTSEARRAAEIELIEQGGVFRGYRNVQMREFLGQETDKSGKRWFLVRTSGSGSSGKPARLRVTSLIVYRTDDRLREFLKGKGHSYPNKDVLGLGRMVVEAERWFEVTYTVLKVSDDDGERWRFISRVADFSREIVDDLESEIRSACRDLIAGQRKLDRSDVVPAQQQFKSGFIGNAKCEVRDGNCIFSFDVQGEEEKCGGDSPLKVRRFD